jgi:GrpB-like predicted nucleotidyltransferase (UPF0157 family)
VHHVGSTSIADLLAKPKIDMICVVDQLSSALKLLEHGYRCMGELNIPLRLGFAKRTADRKVNLHVVEPGHAFITINLTFRNYLREHEEARDAYNQLKLELLEDPKSFERQKGRFYGYTLGKDRFIKSILQQARYNEFALNFPMHDAEWEAYERLAGQRGDLCFILYHGTNIVGAGTEEKLIVEDEKYREPFAQLLVQWNARRIETL